MLNYFVSHLELLGSAPKCLMIMPKREEKKHTTEYTSEFQFSNNSHIQHFANDIFLSRI